MSPWQRFFFGLLLGLVLGAAATALATRYTIRAVTGKDGPGAYRLDRWTGHIRFFGPDRDALRQISEDVN